MLKRLNPEIALGFLLATILWIGALGWSLSYAPTEIEKQTCQEKAQKSGGKTEDCKSLWEKTTSDPVAFFTFVLSISTVALFGSTAALWQVTRKSANIAERALIDLERAYLFIEGVAGEANSLVFYLDKTANWNPAFEWPTFRFSLVNYGRTAGNIDFGLIRFEVLTHTPVERTKIAALNSTGHFQPVEIIVGPDRPISWERLKCEHEFTKEHGAAIRDGTSFLYCHGLFTYFDIFMKSHTIKFCRRYDPSSGDWAPDGGKERNYSN